MTGRLDGKVVIITGVNGSIGRAAALTFAREGGRIVGSGLDPASTDSIAREVRAAGGETVVRAPADLTQPSEAQALVDLAIQTYGRIDVLFNNAAMAYFNWLEDISDAEWDRNRREEVDALLPAADRALQWITDYGDKDGDGYVEYQRTTDHGLQNQGWKDS